MADLPTAIITFNCGRELVEPAILASHIVHALHERLGTQQNANTNGSAASPPSILALSLQEIAPIAYSFLGGSFLASYLSRFQAAVNLIPPYWAEITSTTPSSAYTLITAHNVGMTALMLFAREDIVSQIQDVRAGGVGVGWSEMGNKGSVGIRFTHHDSFSTDIPTELTFVAAHLAPMEWNCARRNEDWQKIVEGVVFTSQARKSKPSTASDPTEEETPLLQSEQELSKEAGIYDTSSWVFVAGDLNYRTSDAAPTAEDANSFKRIKGRSDPELLKQLQSRDQLTRERKAGHVLHGFDELAVDFPPTYKHSAKARQAAGLLEQQSRKVIDSDITGGAPTQQSEDVDDSGIWNWSSHRWPSWCDRVLFWSGASAEGAEQSLSQGVTAPGYHALPLMSTSDHQPVLFAVNLRSPSVAEVQGDERRSAPSPYTINPRWRSQRAAARWKEIGVGVAAYLALTWEGNGLVLATLAGALGGWAMIQSLLME